MNQSELKQILAGRAKRGKRVRAGPTRLVFVLLLTGWESGTSFANQSQGVVNKKQSANWKQSAKIRITVDSWLKTTLIESHTWIIGQDLSFNASSMLF